MPFDPDQPRDEKGQWTAGDAAVAIRRAASFNTNLMHGLKMVGAKEDIVEKALPKLEEDEAVIRNQTYEFASGFDSNGNKIIDKITQGNVRGVEFTDEQLEKLKGGILTHNHPAGRSFSFSDIRLAYKAGLYSIRVAGSQDYDYEFYPKHNFDLSSSDDYERFNEIYRLVNDQITDEITDRIEKNEVTVEWANLNHHHEVNKLFAEKIGAKYVRKNNKQHERQKTSFVSRAEPATL